MMLLSSEGTVFGGGVVTVSLWVLLFVVVAKVITLVKKQRENARALGKFPGPQRHWLLGHVHKLQPPDETGGLKWTDEMSAEYVYGFPIWFGPVGYLNISHPEYAKTILATAEPKDDIVYRFVKPWIGDGLLVSHGQKWFRNRRLLTPAFHFGVLQPYTHLFSDSTNIMMANWKQLGAGASINVFEHVSLMTLDSMLKCALTVDSNCQVDSLSTTPNQLIRNAKPCPQRQTLSATPNLVRNTKPACPQHQTSLSAPPNQLVRNTKPACPQHQTSLSTTPNQLVRNTKPACPQHQTSLSTTPNQLVRNTKPACPQHQTSLSATPNQLVRNTKPACPQHQTSLSATPNQLVRNTKLTKQNPYVAAVYGLTNLTLQRFLLFPLHSDLIYYLTPMGYRFWRLCRVVHQHSETVIRDRREALKNEQLQDSGQRRKYLDFLDILLKTKDENGNGLSDAEIRDEVDTFMFEGHDTTASGLSWTLYNLARHPERQARCRQEARSVLGGRSEVTGTDLSNLPYITMCIKESMRLHTTVPGIARKLTKPITFPDGKSLPPGVRPVALPT
ncbi:CYP4B1 [Branchiostoma lanceolatum]|uniref:CYP4B1 protein n=1 Tax=Branchiostoma lanceolatum TaxID=7740 RepID=A0A8J9YWV1_BRALA|nr:CYP4B1 [Branchiostoma lanceolatum]